MNQSPTAYIVDPDHGIYAGPYPTFGAANTAAESTTLQTWFIAGPDGLPHPDMDPLVERELLADWQPFPPLDTLTHVDLDAPSGSPYDY